MSGDLKMEYTLWQMKLLQMCDITLLKQVKGKEGG